MRSGEPTLESEMTAPVLEPGLSEPPCSGPHNTGSGTVPSREPRPVTFGPLLNEIWTGCWSRENWPGSAVARLIGVFLFAGLCSWAGIVLARQSEGVATIWLSNGILFGLLVTQPPRRWLPYFIAGLTADTLADVVYGDPFRVAFGVSLANSVEVVTSALVLTRMFGAPLDLSKRRPLIGFLAVSVVGATALTSALGASWTLLFYADAGSWAGLYRTWWLGDMLGMAVLAPLILMLQRTSSYAVLRPSELPQTLFVLLAPLLSCVLIFTHNADPLVFLLFPALLLVAFRLGFPGTVLAIVLVTILAIGFTVRGHGPLMLITGPHMLLHRIVVAQILAAVLIFTMFPVAALLEEQDALKQSLAASEARYRELAQSDELTGLANRRAFNLRLAAEWDIAATNRTPIGLLLIDADHFKQYNDVFGHLEGDDCLRTLAQVLAGSMQFGSGLAARFGGEEFAVLLPGADGETARKIAETVRLAVVAQRLPHPTGPNGIQTVSVGVSAVVPTDALDAMVLVRRADEALYCAKLGGRDQVAYV